MIRNLGMIVCVWSAVAIGATTAPTLSLIRQDHGELGLGRSVMDTPLKIGSKPFEHGLGTHSTSEIAVRMTAGSIKHFGAVAGIDNNFDTSGRLGTAQFSVEIGGKEVWKSEIKKGGEEGAAVDVDIPADATAIVLKVNDGGDGPAHDHADWADAKVVLADGKTVYLDALPAPALWPDLSVPFSFAYDGKRSGELLAGWKRETSGDTTSWTDPKTALRVSMIKRSLDDCGAEEWLMRFENTGKQDTPILENVQVLDATLATGASRHLVLDQIRGDDASENSFIPMERELKSGEKVALAPGGGRPSNGTFPFFALECGNEHIFVAVGWTGQWAAALARSADGLHIQAGMELTHLKLHPGESIRTPRILLQHTRGDRAEAHNAFRRLLLKHYVPRYSGELPKFALAAQTFNMVFGSGIRPEWATEAGQIAAAKLNKEMGYDTLWMDAGWFDGNFPMGVGNWTVKQKEFPRGLAPVGKACDELGLKFLVWYEPERVAPNTRITREHPEFILSAGQPKTNGGLFNLADEKARRWMTDLLLQQIDEFGIDSYRNDFNMDPLGFWRANDEPDRQGITEIRYVEGFYQMWDEIRAKHPGMVMDDCASGGRRIDLEMVMRSVVQTRSDAAVAPGRSTWHQSETYGLSLFLPLHASIGWETDAYGTRSVGTIGVCFEWDILDPKFPIDAGKAAAQEIKSCQKYWSGDYYPMTPFSFAGSAWMAWQLDRADLGEGIVLAFRREACPYSAMELSLRGIVADAQYRVEISDEKRHLETKTMRGSELQSMELHLPARRSSVLVRYAKVGA